MSDNNKDNAVVLCASSSYEEKYYFNQEFAGLPEAVKEELKAMCVLYTAEIGGILTLQFGEDGRLFLNVTSSENDFFFDEIGSVLKIKQIQSAKRELLEELELYFCVKFLKKDITGLNVSIAD